VYFSVGWVGGGVIMCGGFIRNLVVACIIVIRDLVYLFWYFCGVCIIFAQLVFLCVVLCLVRGIWLVLCILWYRVGNVW
jgi:hypothetical protein